MSKIIPNGWRKVKLGEVCKLLRGKGISKGQISETGKNKCVLYGELYTTYSEIIKEVKSRTDCDEGTKSKKGDILIPGSTTTTGIDLANAVALNEDGVLLGGDINILRKKDDSYNSKFLAYYLTHIKKGDIMRLTQGITIVHLYGKHLEEIELILPPRELQDKLAEIIKTTDDAINDTDSIIKESQKIKKGLLQSLFQTGIERFHKKYKDTEIGKIPESWDVVKFGDVLDVKAGLGFKYSEYTKEGTPLLKIDNVSHEEIIWENVSYLPEDYLQKYPELSLKEGDILLALNRPITQGKLKIGVLRSKDVPAILYQRVGKILFKKTIDRMYVYYMLLNRLKRFIERHSVGSDQPFINLTQLRKMKIPLPPKEEQEDIAGTLISFDKKIDVELKKKKQLLNIKKGLMQKLLTGQIRVEVD